MKRIILFIFLISGFYASVFALPIDECKTDIYFGNGVWNKQFSIDGCVDDVAADCSRAELDNLIKKEIIKGNPALQAKYGKVKLFSFPSVLGGNAYESDDSTVDT